jgi:hypothetical protein
MRFAALLFGQALSESDQPKKGRFANQLASWQICNRLVQFENSTA